MKNNIKKDLSDCTFIIPIRIESDDRLRNIITVLCYLIYNFNTNIIVKEVDEESKFDVFALPQIKEFCEDISSLNYIFEKSLDPLFLREKILNEMLVLSTTKVIVNYDCDMLLPINSYIECYDKILGEEYDMIYPYGEGRNWLSKVNATDKLVSDFLNNDFNFDILKSKSQEDNAGHGWIQFISRNVYFESGMENENFMGSAPDDYERYYRFVTLGYKVGRFNGEVFHLEHSRGMNSYPQSMTQHPYWNHNWNLWKYLESCNREELIEYYSKQEYLKKYQ